MRITTPGSRSAASGVESKCARSTRLRECFRRATASYTPWQPAYDRNILHRRSSIPSTQRCPPDWQAIEAPFIVSHHGFYYLFVSFDLCCRGTRSNYRTMVGRSKSVTGPYLDKAGIPLLQGGGTLLLGPNQRWLGPGGESILHQADGSDLIVFHAYDATTGRPALQISSLVWRDGWPVATLGEE